MAFESKMIACMNNPAAIEAWRMAKWINETSGFWERLADDRRKRANQHFDNCRHYQSVNLNLQRELLAAREESRALHAELGELHEKYTYALGCIEDYADAIFDQDIRLQNAEKIAARRSLVAIASVSILLIGLWAAFAIGGL